MSEAETNTTEEKAPEKARPTPFADAGLWTFWASAAALGALLSLAASQWSLWGEALRLGFFGLLHAGAAALLCVLAARPSKSRAADAAGVLYAASVLALLAVMGQTWQTGAGAGALFAAAAAVLLPALLALRRAVFAGVWYAVLLAAFVFLGLPEGGGFDAVLEGLFPAASLSCAALVLLAPLRRFSRCGRGTLFLPTAVFTALCAALPSLFLAVDAQDFGICAGYGALFAAGAAALLLLRDRALRCAALFGAALWLNGIYAAAAQRWGFSLDFMTLGFGTLLNAAFLWGLSRAGRGEAGDEDVLDMIPRACVNLIASVLILFLLGLADAALELSALETAALGLGFGFAGGLLCRIRGWGRPGSEFWPTLAFLLAAAGFAALVLSGSIDGMASAALLGGIGLAGALLWNSGFSLALGLVLPTWFAPELLTASAAAASILAAADAAAGVFAAENAFGSAVREAARRFTAGAAGALLFIGAMAVWDGSDALLGPGGSEAAARLEALRPWCAAPVLLAALAMALRGGSSAALRHGVLLAALAAASVFGAWSALAWAGVLTGACAALRREGRAGVGRTLMLAAVFLATSVVVWLAPSGDGRSALLEGAAEYGRLALAFAAAALAAGWGGSLGEAARSRLRHAPAAAAALAALALAGMGGLCAYGAASGERFVMRLEPSDPRDILLGDYMALRYADARVSSESSEAPVRAALRVKEGLLRAETALSADEACPADAALCLPLRRGTDEVRLPSRWFFPSGEAERWSGARFAALRCTNGACFLEALLDEERRPLNSEGRTKP